VYVEREEMRTLAKLTTDAVDSISGRNRPSIARTLELSALPCTGASSAAWHVLLQVHRKALCVVLRRADVSKIQKYLVPLYTDYKVSCFVLLADDWSADALESLQQACRGLPHVLLAIRPQQALDEQLARQWHVALPSELPTNELKVAERLLRAVTAKNDVLTGVPIPCWGLVVFGVESDANARKFVGTVVSAASAPQRSLLLVGRARAC
jgi:hypothetical protein